jgi:uncharacterized Zn finger protein
VTAIRVAHQNEVIRMTDGDWLFQCPECSVTHHEMACFAADDEIYCIVCWEDNQQTIRLHRWIELPAKTELAAAD